MTRILPIFLATFAVFGCKVTGSGASSLKDESASSSGLQYKSYKVLFTNPLCREYVYNSPIRKAGGDGTVRAKPKNVYCTRADFEPAGNRPQSPQYQIVEWIKPLQEGDEVFLAFLSYSNYAVARELCAAARRGVKVTFVLDAPTDLSNQLKDCGGTILLRGHAGGIGYAHNKVIMINPSQPGPGDEDKEYMKLAFASANMSSGVVLHHENWHFVEVKRRTYFAESHLCLMRAQLSESSSSSKERYTRAINECRGQIEAPQERDIHAFFIPNQDDSETITEWMVWGIENAKRVDIAAHRFSYQTMLNALRRRLRDDQNFSVRLVVDDDIYWLSPLVGEGEQVGDNAPFEASNIRSLASAGGSRFAVRYMETNHAEHLLHHNKIMIFYNLPGYPDSVIAGAPNFTGTGYWSNFENVYWIQIPAVVEEFKKQYARFWDGTRFPEDTQDPPRATRAEDMPERNVLP